MLKQFGGTALLCLAVALPSEPVATATILQPGECVGLRNAACPGSVQDLSDGSDLLNVIMTTGPETITGIDGANDTVWSAILQQYVVQDLTTNSLDFWYYVDVTSGPLDINAVITNGFAGSSTDVGVTCTNATTQGPCQTEGLPTGTVAPTDISRSVDGDALTFMFGGGGVEALALPANILPSGSGLSPLNQPYLMIINTDATSFTSSTTTLTGGGGMGSAASFAPALVPEPAFQVLFLAGLLGMALLLRKRGIAAQS
jgi:hypothetical protein